MLLLSSSSAQLTITREPNSRPTINIVRLNTFIFWITKIERLLFTFGRNPYIIGRRKAFQAYCSTYVSRSCSQHCIRNLYHYSQHIDLRHHPSWVRLIEEARGLGGPFVFRLNLNQQSSGAEWEIHKALMETTSPIVDCGVHYVDVMCQITDAAPVRVHGMGLRLSQEIAEDMYNYGQFQVVFADGSVGWYEAGWGPMMSETAFFVKDIVSPNGSVSITEGNKGASSDIDGHTKVGGILVHTATGDRLIELPEEPGHQELCDAQQAFMLRSISEDIDLTRHMSDAVTSLSICLAADESIRTGQPISLEEAQK